MQKLAVSPSTASSYGSCRGAAVEDAAEAEFPAGMRVLVVDDDVTCLRILEHMLQRCRYRVTTCCQATMALSLLRESKGGYDVVISDVHMPDMDGFKLLELVGLEMDLPVIMMSADGRTSAVMRGIKHGACDYLIKPVRIEELKNIWQHVIRKKWSDNKELEHSGSLEDSDRHERVVDDADYSSSVNDGADGNWRSQKKKRDSTVEEDDGELDNEDPSSSKKPRVVWSVELHQQFVSAVNQLGIEKAVPKRILELMNVPGLTRENVASHLQQISENVQKFRLYLKRLSGVAQHQSALSNSFCGSMEPNAKVGSLGRLNFQTLAALGQIAPQTLAALHAELMGRPSGGLVLPAIDPPVLMQASVQRPNCIHVETAPAVGQPLLKCQSNISKQLPQSSIPVEDISGFSAWSSVHLGTAGPSRGVNNTQNCNTLVQMLQQQPYPAQAESNHAINVQPSRLVVPSQSSNSFQITNSPVFLNQNSVAIPSQTSTSFQFGTNPVTIKQSSISNNTKSVGDYILFSSQSNDVSLNARQVTDEGFKNGGMLDGYSTHGPLPSPISSCSARIGSNTGWKARNLKVNAGPTHSLPDNLPNLSFLATEQRAPMLSDAGHGRYPGFVGKGTCIPSRFAVDDIESPTKDVCNKKTCTDDDGGRLKQEIQLDIMEGYNFGDTVQPYFSSNNMGVLSE